MSKSHIVNISIINSTDLELQYNHDWFDSGRLADDNHWPTTIKAGDTVHIECYEKDWALTGCSGWVKYIVNTPQYQGKELFFCFSNPLAGKNGIAFGANTNTWNSMGGEYNNGITPSVQLKDNIWLVAHISSTDSDNNQAIFELKKVDVGQVVAANILMDDVVSAFNSISPSGTRQYYQSVSAPTNITGIAQSHFKGISVFADKFIFSHTNLTIPSSSNGVYLVADKITRTDTGSTELTTDTAHQGWPHPCSSQACGSFMALGIQESADNPTHKSEIEIYDIRKTQINQPASLIGVISRDTNVNGVAMTKEIGGDGKYIVACIDGSDLVVYKSSSSNLLTTKPSFTQAMEIKNFPESGPGIALITQKNGDIYLLAMNANDDGSDNHISLFKLDLANSKATQVGKKDMPIPGMSRSITLLEDKILAIIAFNPIIGGALEVLLKTYGETYLNSSFRWGKGLSITSSQTFEIYATDRNSLPLSDIPLVGSDQDFSLVTWKNINLPMNTHLAIQTQNGNYLTIVNQGGLDGHNVFATNRKVVGDWEKFKIEIVDAASGTFALKTHSNNYVTAINGGGLGGPNDASSPIHTDTKKIGGWEDLVIEPQADGTVALKTPTGYYLTALNGGGIADKSGYPLATNRSALGPWEKFKVVLIK
jgi:hypothetical protein